MTLVKRHLLMLLLVLVMVVVARAQSPKEIIGQWKDNEEPKRVAEFYLGDDGLYYARIIRDEEDDANKGKILIKKLKYDEQSKSYKGFVSPPDIDVEINATVTWINKDTLLVVAKNFFKTKKIQFSRIKGGQGS